MEIERVVRLSFRAENVSDFLVIFNQSKNKILAMEGCLALRLMRDLHDSSVYYTLSLWASPDALENYRQSVLFRETWSKTKALFSAPAVTFSLVPATGEPEML